MNQKITTEHLTRGAVVYVRQSTMGQVSDHTESQQRQYALAETARKSGFAFVTVIDDDLGRTGSGLVERPGFQKLVAAVCSGSVGAVFCIEASRLARNGRDWHHLIDLCALVGTVVVDPDGAYDPRLINDRLLLGLKGTMSEYELSLLRQRGLAARDSKAKRGELRFALPPGYCWNELGQIEIDPDQRVADAVKLVFCKFREFGSARQVLLWTKNAGLKLPVLRQSPAGCRIDWQSPAYHTVLQVLQHPVYAGAYVFGRRTQRIRVVEGRARKTGGHAKPMHAWNVLLRGHHPGYITWEEFEKNQTMISENAHMQKRTSRKSARGGRALLTGLVRCGRCGRPMRVSYGMKAGHAHRYQCFGDHVTEGVCIGIGGMRIDQAVAAQIVEAVSDHAVEAALRAASATVTKENDVRRALVHELEQAQYNASLAGRRYEAVDPTKRLVARELEARWNSALEQVTHVEERIAKLDAAAASRPAIVREDLMTLAHDLPAVWNSPRADARTKQRIARILIEEVVIDLDNKSNEAVVTIHWSGGRHTEVRVTRVRTGRPTAEQHPSPVEVVRKLAGKWSDRELAVTMNRMRCKSSDGKSWTALRVRTLRERLGIAEFDPAAHHADALTIEQTARRLQICIGSVRRLIGQGVLPATQAFPFAPWEIPAASLESDEVRIGVQGVIRRRRQDLAKFQQRSNLKLPGF
jgi:DNA invertase Pin-like site-specific DNA recombinase